MLGVLPLLGNEFGVDAIGYYGNVISIGSFLGTIFIFRTELSIISNDRDSFKSNFTCSLVLSVLIFSIVFFLLLHSGTLEYYFEYVFFAVSFILIMIVQMVANNLKRYQVASFLKLLVAIIFPTFSLIIYDPTKLALGHSIANIIVSVSFILYFRKLLSFEDLLDLSKFINFFHRCSGFIKYSLPSSTISAAIGFLFPSVVFFIFGSQEAGIVFMLFKVMMAPISIVGMSIGQIIRKEFTSILHEQSVFRDRFIKLLFSLCVLSVLYSISMSVIIESFLVEILSSEWLAVKDYYILFILLPSIMVIYVPMSQFYLVLSKQKYDLIFQLANATSITIVSCISYHYSLSLENFILLYSTASSLIYGASSLYIVKLSKILSNQDELWNRS